MVAVCAGLVYLSLLQLPGSGAFKVFHPMLLQKALDTFYLYPDNTSAGVYTPTPILHHTLAMCDKILLKNSK